MELFRQADFDMLQGPSVIYRENEAQGGEIALRI
jgi:hypothetical protein